MPPIETTRPPTDEERALLAQAPVTLFGWWTGIVSAACVFILTFLVVSLAATRLPYTVVIRGAVTLAILASIAAYLWIQRKSRQDLRVRMAHLSREATAEYVRSTVYRVTDAIGVDEQEDEGLSFYLLLDDGRTLFLSGQYLYEPVENGFPWKAFEVVRVASGRWVLRVVPLGLGVTPSWKRPPFSEREYTSGAIPLDGSIERRDFDALKRQVVSGLG